MVHVQMDGRPMVAPTTMLVRKLFDKPEFTYPFSKFFGVQNLFFKKGFASPSPSPINPNLKGIRRGGFPHLLFSFLSSLKKATRGWLFYYFVPATILERRLESIPLMTPSPSISP